MEDSFKIFIEQLREGRTEEIKECFSPAFLQLQEDELHFLDKIAVDGEAYLADDDLVLHLDIDAQCSLPCSICNGAVLKKVNISDFYYTVPVKKIKSGVYDYQKILRETILLETPAFAECNEGKCPQRKQIEKYFKKESSVLSEVEEGYQPFANLDLDKIKKQKF
jgi:uncharacterized metal-binding protein YceD (DUF177 family)